MPEYRGEFREPCTTRTHKSIGSVRYDIKRSNFIVEQKLKTYTLRYLKEKYSKYIYEESNLKEYSSITLGKTFNKNSLEIGINSKSFFEENKDYKSDNVYLGIHLFSLLFHFH